MPAGIDQYAPRDRMNRPDPTDLPELQSFMSAGSLINKDDNEISSTTAFFSTSPADTRRRLQARERQQRRLIRWTWQQAELADALTGLVQKLVQHHYPALASSTSVIRGGEKADKLDGKTHFGQVQPDSSSSTIIDDKNPHGIDFRTIANASFSSVTNNLPTDKRAQAAAQWYELVSIALWKLLLHEHLESEKVCLHPSLFLKCSQLCSHKCRISQLITVIFAVGNL